MARRRIHRTDAEIVEQLADFDASGLTQQDYAELHEFSISTLRDWLRRRRSGELESAPILVAVEITSPAAGTTDHRFVELFLAPDVHLRAQEDIEPDRLADLVIALRNRCLA